MAGKVACRRMGWQLEEEAGQTVRESVLCWKGGEQQQEVVDGAGWKRTSLVSDKLHIGV